jgi:N-acetylmuramoyl-L-alanine amidase
MRCVLLILLCCAQLAWAAPVEVKGVRVWAGPEYTRAVFDLSGKAEYKVFKLEAPDRLVLDIDRGRNLAYALPAPSGAISGLRSGQPEKDKLRIVFDLAEQAQVKSFLLPPAENYGHRLVVDLYPDSKPQVQTVKRAPEPAAEEADQRKVIVAIDAGHGGEDPGAVGPAGTYEKHVALAVARELARRIDREPGMKAVLIRDGDYFIPLQQRFRKAREAKADLFVSIHADAAHAQSASGSSVYIMSARGATTEAARWLAERENRSDLVGGVSLETRDDTLAAVLLDLSQGASMEASAEAADRVLAALKRVGKTHKKQVERANFVVLRSPDVPSMLIETAFISNPAEEKRLKDPKHQAALADAVMEGVRDYFHSRPPPGTWIAAHAKPSSHVVSRGETLSVIAQRHRVSVDDLRSVNAKRDDQVQVGEVLRLPTSS